MIYIFVTSISYDVDSAVLYLAYMLMRFTWDFIYYSIVLFLFLISFIKPVQYLCFIVDFFTGFCFCLKLIILISWSSAHIKKVFHVYSINLHLTNPQSIDTFVTIFNPIIEPLNISRTVLLKSTVLNKKMYLVLKYLKIMLEPRLL